MNITQLFYLLPKLKYLLAVTAVISSTFMLSRKKNRETYRQEGGKIKEGRGEKGKVSNGELSDDKIQPMREKGNTAE